MNGSRLVLWGGYAALGLGVFYLVRRSPAALAAFPSITSGAADWGTPSFAPANLNTAGSTTPIAAAIEPATVSAPIGAAPSESGPDATYLNWLARQAHGDE